MLSRSIYSNKVGITVFVADYDSQIQADRGTWITKSFYLLDAILGEWDMIMHMDEIQFKSWDCDLFESSGGGKVLELLADEFDEILVKKINFKKFRGPFVKTKSGYQKPVRWMALVVSSYLTDTMSTIWG